MSAMMLLVALLFLSSAVVTATVDPGLLEDSYLSQARADCDAGRGCALYHALRALDELLGTSPTARVLAGPLRLVPSATPAAEDSLLEGLAGTEPADDDSPARAFLKFVGRLARRFVRTHDVAWQLPQGVDAGADAGGGGGRHKRKQLLILLPLAVMHIKALLVPILLAVLFIKKLLVVGVMMLPTLLGWLKVCKRPHHSWLAVTDYEEPHHHHHHPHLHPYHHHYHGKELARSRSYPQPQPGLEPTAYTSANHDAGLHSFPSAPAEVYDDHGDPTLAKRRWRTQGTAARSVWAPGDAAQTATEGLFAT